MPQDNFYFFTPSGYNIKGSVAHQPMLIMNNYSLEVRNSIILFTNYKMVDQYYTATILQGNIDQFNHKFIQDENIAPIDNYNLSTNFLLPVSGLSNLQDYAILNNGTQIFIKNYNIYGIIKIQFNRFSLYETIDFVNKTGKIEKEYNYDGFLESYRLELENQSFSIIGTSNPSQFSQGQELYRNEANNFLMMSIIFILVIYFSYRIIQRKLTSGDIL